MRRWSWAAWGCVLAPLFLLARCSEKTQGQLVVVLNTDLAVPGDIDSVHLEANGTGTTFDRPAVSAPFLGTIGVLKGNGDGPYTIRISARRAGVDVVRTHFSTTIPDRVVAFPVFLSASCRTVACSGNQTCLRGQCVDPNIDGNLLPAWDPNHDYKNENPPVGTGQPSDAGANQETGSDTGPLLTAQKHALSIGSSVCAVRQNGHVICWGNPGANASGGAPGQATTSGAEMPGIANAVGVVTTGDRTYVVESDGTLWAWGSNGNGQLGIGPSDGGPLLAATQVPGLTNVVAVAANTHACTLHSDRTVSCWGPNDNGQLGDGTTFRRDAPRKVQDSNGKDLLAVRLTVGNQWTCVVTPAGQPLCWGASSPQRQLVPGPIDGIPGEVTDIFPGYSGEVCARIQNGEIKCWSGCCGKQGAPHTASESSATGPCKTSASDSVVCTGGVPTIPIEAGVSEPSWQQGPQLGCAYLQSGGSMGEGISPSGCTIGVPGVSALEQQPGTMTCALGTNVAKCWGCGFLQYYQAPTWRCQFPIAIGNYP